MRGNSTFSGRWAFWTGPIEKGMVFEIEAWENFEKTLIGVEDCYVVTDDGCRKMTTLDKHIISV